MTKRGGLTEKLSISLNKSDAAALRKRAKRLHGGNLSATIGELAADARRLEAMVSLLDELGGPSLNDAERRALDEAWTIPAKGVSPKPRKKERTGGKAA